MGVNTGRYETQQYASMKTHTHTFISHSSDELKNNLRAREIIMNGIIIYNELCVIVSFEIPLQLVKLTGVLQGGGVFSGGARREWKSMERGRSVNIFLTLCSVPISLYFIPL